MTSHIMRTVTIALLAGTGLTLGACAGQSNRTLYPEHQPVVERSQYVIDLNVAAGGLAAGEQARLDQWMDALEIGYGDRIAIDAPDGNAAMTTRQQIGAVAGNRGLLLADYAPITEQPFIPGTVRVVVSRSTAYVPGCPDWSNNSQTDFNNSTHSNFGCATNANRAAMVANPEDLIRGQRGDPSTRAGVEAIKQYREAGPRYGEGDLASGVSGSTGSGGGQ